MSKGSISTERNAVVYIRRLPRDVKAHFKAWCTKREISLTDAIIEIMRMVPHPQNEGFSKELTLRCAKERQTT